VDDIDVGAAEVGAPIKAAAEEGVCRDDESVLATTKHHATMQVGRVTDGPLVETLANE
jgi:hypothetical protein